MLRDALRKASLRTVLSLRLLREKDEANREAIRKLLVNQAAFNAVYEGLREGFDATSTGAPVNDTPTWLQFLIDNLDDIILMILKLLPLFI